MKSILKILLGIVEIAVIIFAIFMVSVIFMRNDFGYTQYGKNTLIFSWWTLFPLPHFKLIVYFIKGKYL
mgnify:CR=1 FL=1